MVADSNLPIETALANLRAQSIEGVNSPLPSGNDMQSLEATPGGPQQPTLKKRRGRPPKNKEDAPISPQQSSTPIKKRRGRPPKNRDALLPGSTPQQPAVSSGHDTFQPPFELNRDEIRTSNANSISALPETPRRQLRISSQITTPAGEAAILDSTQQTDERPVRKAVFTSNDEIERQEGTSRVYIDLPGTQKPGDSGPKPEPSCIAVFKSTKLKDASYLTQGKHSWALHAAELRQKDLELVEKNTERPKRNKTGRTNKKRQKLDAAEKATSEEKETQQWLNRDLASDCPQRTQEQASSAYASLLTPPPQSQQIQGPPSYAPILPPSARYTLASQGYSNITNPIVQQRPNGPVQDKTAVPPVTAGIPRKVQRGKGSQKNTKREVLPLQNSSHRILQSTVKGLPPFLQNQVFLSQMPYISPYGPSAGATSTASTHTTPSIGSLPAHTPSPNQTYGRPSATNAVTSCSLSPAIFHPSVSTERSPSIVVTTPCSPSPYMQDPESDNGLFHRKYQHLFDPLAAQASPTSQVFNDNEHTRPANNASTYQHRSNSPYGVRGDFPATSPYMQDPAASPLPESDNGLFHRKYQHMFDPLAAQVSQFLPPAPLSSTHPPYLNQSELLQESQEPSSVAPDYSITTGETQTQESLRTSNTSGNVTRSTPSARRDTQKTPRSRKRKQPTIANSQADSQNGSQAKVQKQRNAQMPGQIHHTNVDERFEELLQLVGQVAVPNGQTRLSCYFQDRVGNLILSEDVSTLEFFCHEQHPPELPILTLLVGDISEHPITSVRGSDPMQIQIKVSDSDENSGSLTHCFKYGKSHRCSQAASNLREKIVLGMIAERFKAGENYQRPVEAQERISKPIQCEICGSRFKQRQGLDYHLKKSSSTCNPNFDPSTKTPRSGRKPKEGVQRSLRKPREGKFVPDHGDDSDSGATSEASLIAWAKKTAGVSPEYNSTPGTKKTRVYKALNRESEVLQEIIENISVLSEAASDSPSFPTNITAFPSELPTLTDLASRISPEEELSEALCREMLIALVCANHGMFPGQKSLWIACVALWLKMHPIPHVLPRYTLCCRSIDDLVDEKILRFGTFLFNGRKSRHVIQTFILLPNADTTGPRCEMLKSLVEECHPGIYVPSHLAPPQPILDKLHAVATRAVAPVPIRPPGEMGSEEVEDLDEFDSSSRDSSLEEDFSDEDEFEVGDFEDDGQFDSEPEGENEVADILHLEPTRRRRSRRRNPQLPDGKRYRSPTTNARIAESLRLHWSGIRAGKFPAPRRPSRPVAPSRPPTRPRKRPVPSTGQTTGQTWNPALSFLPNPDTGAWDLASPDPGPVKKGRPAGSAHSPVPRLPEPITFMQAMDGSWSVRPFGHGVKPIYSRPARRADGNPNFQAYLKKIEAGHRPIVYPTKNRIYLPSAPSKKLLADLAKGSEHVAQTAFEDSEHLTQDAASSKQKRKYARKSAVKEPTREVSEDEMDLEFDGNVDILDMLPSRYPKRKSTRRTSINDTETQDTEVVPPEPKKLALGAPRNPGLETVPPRFGLNPSIYQGPDLDDLDFPKKYFSIIFTGQKHVEDGVDLRWECSWTIHELQTADEGYQLHWDDSFAFTSQTLPYSDLGDDCEIPQEAQPQIVAPRKKRPRLHSSGPLPSLKVKVNWQRTQLALPHDFEGLLKDPKDAAAMFSIEVALPSERSKKRQRHVASNMSQVDENRLIVAIVIQRILTGGLEQSIDWVLIGSIFQDYSLNFLTACWKRLSVGKEEMMKQLGREFQKAYPVAYEEGEVPPFNYDAQADNDWQTLIQWAQNKLSTNFGNKPLVIPGTKEDLYDSFDVVQLEMAADWRELFFGLTTAVYKRIEVAATEPRTVPIVRPLSVPAPADDELAKSWVRAVALTPESDWSLAAGKEKIQALGLDVVEQTLKNLISSKVLMHRAKNRVTPGRAYEATEAFWITLRKHMKEPQFLEAVTYKRWMDEQFRIGTPCLAVDFMANEGTILCLSSLQASERISIQCVNVPLEKFGLTDGSYETKKIPRERLRIDMVIYPTDTYLYDDENEDLHSILSTLGPNDEQYGRIPVWYGVTGYLVPDLWKRVVMAVSQVVALRSGINIDGLAKLFKPTLEVWELRLLMDWGVKVGLFERLNLRVEGWTVGEWWWLAVANLCTMY